MRTVATEPLPLSSLASMTTPSAGRSGLAFSSKHFGLENDGFQQFVEAKAGLGGDFNVERFAADGFDEHFVLQQPGADLLRIGIVLVDLVDGDDDRHARRLGMIDRFNRLRHDGIVGGHHQNGDVGRLRAAGTHGGEGGVARRVDEGDLVAVALDLVGADMLGDAAGLAGDDIGLADGVEQRGLAVIDMAHDGDDRRARERDRPQRPRR